MGQNWIARQVTNRLSRNLHAKVSIQHVDFSLLNRMHMEGVLVHDQHGDTLIYAGDLKVNITDWFIFKKNAEFKYIGLDNALIKFQRTDSVWNQQFLFDYFSSPSTGNKKKGGIQFDLKKVEMHNVTFLQIDKWQGNDMTLQVADLSLDANNVDFSKQIMDINSLTLLQPFVSLTNYKGSKATAPVAEAKKIVDSLLQWNQAGWLLNLKELTIKDGVFKTDKQSETPVLKGFDGQHIDFNHINAKLENISWVKDTIKTTMNLATLERSGFEVKKLQADVKFTPKEMAFNNLELRTNKSIIRNYYRMSYANLDDMADFIHSITMQANFDNTEIDSDDIAFFAPELKSWKKKIFLKGKVKGPLDALVGKDMVVKAGNNTSLIGDLSLTGLPTIDKTFIDFKATDFRTTYNDVLSIVPSIRKITTPDLKKLQFINFKGSFTGFIRDFVNFGTIQTNLGTIRLDINMKLPKGKEPVYSGKIATDNFRLGEFLNDGNIGSVSINATIKGKGFDEKTRNTIIDGTILYADYNQYRYQNIIINGKLNKKLFEGYASMNDENAVLELNGIIDFNNKIPLFNLIADIKNTNLKNLKLVKDNIALKGKLNVNFSGSSLDNFTGTARITDAQLSNDDKQLPFDSLIISSAIVNGEKNLTLISNEFNANLQGNFNLAALPSSFTYLLNKYYPSYVKAPKSLPVHQDIKFDISTYFIDDYLQLLDSSFSGFNNSRLKGRLNLDKNELNFTADIPQFKYKKYNFDDVLITANGINDSLFITGRTKNIKINDSLNIPLAVFNINARHDTSNVSIISGANQGVEKADLNAQVLTYADGVKIKFSPSSFTVNGKTWTLDKNGELELRSNNPTAGQLVLTESNQKILLKTQPSLTGKWSDLRVELTNVNVGDFSLYFLPQNRLEGLVSGKIIIENPTGDFKIQSDDIQTQFLQLDNDSLGEVKASLAYNNLSKELKFNGNTVNQENYLGFDGSIFLNDPLKAKNNLIALKTRTFPLSILERFLGEIFSNIQGYLTGDVSLQGDFKDLSVSGKGRLINAGLKVNFTQCFYKIVDTDISLTPEEINLDGIILTDTTTNNPIYVAGGIEHQAFKNMFYNISMTTQKPKTTTKEFNKPVTLLNTNFKNNKQFYGKVKGTGSFSLAGPQADMYMDINAVASDVDSSNITIPSFSSRETGIADFLVERKFGREMETVSSNNNASNIIYNVKVTSTPLVNVRVVLDELTGDEIKGRGTGTLSILSGTTEPLSLRGRFDIDEGNYLFTFQSFFKKPFELRKGTDNYIEWTGDPYDAKINITAVYTANNVSYAPLINSGKSIDQKIGNARSDVYVVAKLTDKLFKPQIDFSLDFPSSSVVYNDPALAFSLQQLQKNPNEINKQATYLVVFGIFAPVETFAGGLSFQEIATSSLSGIFFNVINEQVKKIVSNIFKTEKLNFNFNSSVYNRNVIDASNNSFNLGSNVNASIGSSLFKNKVIVSLGGSVEGLLQSGTIQQNVQVLPNFTIEVLLNPSGSFRANLFYRQNIDYLTSNASGAGTMNRAGLGLSYRKESDKFWQLFFRKKASLPKPVENNN